MNAQDSTILITGGAGFTGKPETNPSVGSDIYELP